MENPGPIKMFRKFFENSNVVIFYKIFHFAMPSSPSTQVMFDFGKNWRKIVEKENREKKYKEIKKIKIYIFKLLNKLFLYNNQNSF